MAADIVPIRLGLTKGDLYTLWAPRWRDAGDEWEALLGKDEDLYGFESVADLVAFIRTNSDNDLTDHPAWEGLIESNAHRFDPPDEREYDLIGVQELLAEKPTEESVATLHRTLAIVSSVGSVCELPAVTKFFNGNPILGSLGAGMDSFSGRSGRKRWAEIATVIGRSWDNVVDAIDEVITTPDVDKAAAEKAAAELEGPRPEPEEIEEADEIGVDDVEGDDVDAEGRDADETLGEQVAAPASTGGLVLGADEDFWLKVGIDPIQMITRGGTFYTLRCYLDDAPVFLGRNGRVSVFPSERAMARYLADEHDHDMAGLPTYDDIRTAATDGSLDIDVTEDNVYVLTGLSDDMADGPDAVDRDQLDLAVEFLRDLGDYSEEDIIDKALAPDRPLGKFVGYVLDDEAGRPAGPYATVVSAFEELERFVETRLRRE